MSAAVSYFFFLIDDIGLTLCRSLPISFRLIASTIIMQILFLFGIPVSVSIIVKKCCEVKRLNEMQRASLRYSVGTVVACLNVKRSEFHSFSGVFKIKIFSNLMILFFKLCKKKKINWTNYVYCILLCRCCNYNKLFKF